MQVGRPLGTSIAESIAEEIDAIPRSGGLCLRAVGLSMSNFPKGKGILKIPKMEGLPPQPNPPGIGLARKPRTTEPTRHNGHAIGVKGIGVLDLKAACTIA